MEYNNDLPAHQVAKVAHEHLRQFFQQRAQIASRIGIIKRTIVGLTQVVGDDLLSDELSELIYWKGTRRQSRVRTSPLKNNSHAG
jgi:hypothetical protein